MTAARKANSVSALFSAIPEAERKQKRGREIDDDSLFSLAIFRD